MAQFLILQPSTKVKATVRDAGKVVVEVVLTEKEAAKTGKFSIIMNDREYGGGEGNGKSLEVSFEVTDGPGVELSHLYWS